MSANEVDPMIITDKQLTVIVPTDNPPGWHAVRVEPYNPLECVAVPVWYPTREAAMKGRCLVE